MSEPTPEQALNDRVRAAYRAVTDEARAEKVAKQHARGKMTARERVALLASGGFHEFGALAGPGPAQQGAAPLVAPGDGVVTGIGYIDGRPAAIAAFDFTVLGGSNGATGMAKLDRCAERALLDGIPLVMLMDGGGHRMQEALDSRLAAPGSKLLLRLADLSGHVPLVAAMMGPGFGAPANISARASSAYVRTPTRARTSPRNRSAMSASSIASPVAVTAILLPVALTGWGAGATAMRSATRSPSRPARSSCSRSRRRPPSPPPSSSPPSPASRCWSARCAPAA